jgi:hypothetical protein
MSRSDRKSYVPDIGNVILFALLVGTVSYIITDYVPSGCEDLQMKRQERRAEAARACKAPGQGLWLGQIRTPADERECRREQREIENVYVQKRMAKCASAQSGFARFAHILLGLTLITAFGAALYTRKQANVAEDAYRNLERARIVVEPLGVNPKKPVGNDVLNLIGHVGIKNVGRLPANKLSWFACMKFERTRACETFCSPEHFKGGGNVLAPGAHMREGTQTIKTARHKEHSVPEAKVMLSPKTKEDIEEYFYVWGEVRYIDGFSEKPRMTKFCFRYNCDLLRLGDRCIPAEQARHHHPGNDAT